MKTLHPCFGSVAVLTLVTLSAHAADAIQIDIRDMAKGRGRLLAQRVATHGCLVDTGIHGMYIEPCGSENWNEMTFVADPTGKVVAAATRQFKIPSLVVEGDFSGVLVEQDVSGPQSRKVELLELDAISNARPYQSSSGR